MSQTASNSSGIERRVWVRFPCDLNTSCRPYVGGDDSRWAAHLQDISQGGVRIAVERRFEPGTILSISTEIEKDDVPASLMARVVHVKREESGSWSLGCRFAKELTERELQGILGK